MIEQQIYGTRTIRVAQSGPYVRAVAFMQLAPTGRPDGELQTRNSAFDGGIATPLTS